MTDAAVWPWPEGAATGVGSLPGRDVAEAQRVILGELPDFPHLPELPDRGPGADLIGRGAGFLVDLPIELYAGRWRVAGRPGRDLRRTRDLLDRDVDQLTEQAAEFTGPVKVQVAGPWTLAASIELPIGGRLLRDHGAVRDLASSLAEGIAAHVRDVSARLPRATVVLQLDEPSMPAALAGRVPTESGLGTYRAVESSVASELLGLIVDAAGVPVIVHCCAPDVPLDVVRASGAVGVALDLSLVKELDPLGEAIDAGLGLLAGAASLSAGPSPASRAPASGSASAGSASAGSARSAGPAGPDGPGGSASGRPSASAVVADRVRKVWRELGFPMSQLARQVVVTPACGLAGATPAQARAVLAACRDAARRLHEEAAA